MREHLRHTSAIRNTSGKEMGFQSGGVTTCHHMWPSFAHIKAGFNADVSAPVKWRTETGRTVLPDRPRDFVSIRLRRMRVGSRPGFGLNGQMSGSDSVALTHTHTQSVHFALPKQTESDQNSSKPRTGSYIRRISQSEPIAGLHTLFPRAFYPLLVKSRMSR